MKKLFLILAASAALFCSCGKKKNAEIVNGWYSDFDEALKVAQQENKSVVLFVYAYYDTMPGFVASAQNLILNSDKFTKAISDRYVCVGMNMSPDVLEAALDKENGYFADEKVAKRAKIADRYKVSNELPVMLIVSKDGYYITDVTFNCDSYVYEGYVAAVGLKDEDVKFFNDKIEKISKSEGAEAVHAIDEVYDSTPEMLKPLLGPLCEKAVELDKGNETGLLTKFVIANANAKAYNYLLERNVADAISVYENAAGTENIDADGKEYLYSACAKLLIDTRSSDTDSILMYYTKASEVGGQNKKILEAEVENIKKFMAQGN